METLALTLRILKRILTTSRDLVIRLDQVLDRLEELEARQKRLLDFQLLVLQRSSQRLLETDIHAMLAELEEEQSRRNRGGFDLEAAR
jgi:hypothetical protein